MFNKSRIGTAMFGLLLLGVQAQAAPVSFNGTWRIQLVTDAGSCDGSYSYAVAVQDGEARLLAGADDSATTVTGGVGGNGMVSLVLTRSIATANASGRLKGNAGSGTWRLDALGCSGRWTAARRA